MWACERVCVCVLILINITPNSIQIPQFAQIHLSSNFKQPSICFRYKFSFFVNIYPSYCFNICKLWFKATLCKKNIYQFKWQCRPFSKHVHRNITRTLYKRERDWLQIRWAKEIMVKSMHSIHDNRYGTTKNTDPQIHSNNFRLIGTWS